MLRTNERESEILLGNKQLLGIFFAVALLLGVAFYGGYMVGRNSSGKKASVAAETAVCRSRHQPKRDRRRNAHDSRRIDGICETRAKHLWARACRKVEPGFSRVGGRRYSRRAFRLAQDKGAHMNRKFRPRR